MFFFSTALFYLKIALLFLVPGLLLFPKFKKIYGFSLISTLFLCCVTTLVFYVVIFPWFKFFNISLIHFIYVIWITLIPAIVFTAKKLSSFLSEPLLTICVDALVAIYLFFLLMPIYLQQIVPAGADMAMHGYIARQIYDNNGFPESYEPIVPIKTFGSAPYGFGVIAATISLITQVPIYKSLLMMVIVSYFIFYYSLYVVFSNRFNQPTGIIICLLSFALFHNLLFVIGWGGIPGIFSFALLMFVYDQYFYKGNKHSLASLAVSAIFVSAALYIHIIPVYIIFCIYSFPIMHRAFTIWKLFEYKTLHIVGLTTVLFIPYIVGLKIPSQSTLSGVHEWQMQMAQFNISVFHDWFVEIPKYFILSWGYHFTGFMFGISIFGLFVFHKIWQHYLAIFIGVLVLINTRYWLLPLSALLYPDRTMTILLLPCLYITAHVLKLSFNKFRSIESKLLVLGMYVCIFLICAVIFQQGMINYREFLSISRNESKVTLNDVAVMKYLSQLDDSNIVVLNNYGSCPVKH